MKLQGASSYNYWNGAAFQGTIAWNADTGGAVLIPSGIFVSGDVYTWSAATEEASNSLQGPFAADFLVTATDGPRVVILQPAGTIVDPQPTIAWTVTIDTGDTAISFQAIVYTAAQAAIPGFIPGVSPSTWDSGSVTGSGAAIQVGIPLATNESYVAYVQVTETGPITGEWATSSFFENYDAPHAPSITAVSQTDGTTGAPYNLISVQARDNILDYDSAGFEGGTVGQWSATNAALSSSTDQAVAPGTHSLKAICTGIGDAILTLPVGVAGIPATGPSTVFAFVRLISIYAGSTNNWDFTFEQYDAAGTSLFADTNSDPGVPGAWETTSAGGGVLFAAARFVSLHFTIHSPAVGETWYLDHIGLIPGGATPVWSRGGLVGLQEAVLEFSDDAGVNWDYVRNGNGVPVDPSTQTCSIRDYEAVPNKVRSYRAFIEATA
jgi:hypothetical protein